MADHYIGINRGAIGQAENLLTKGTSTGSTDVEVRIADAAGWNRLELRLALEAIIDDIQAPTVITASKFPPG